MQSLFQDQESEKQKPLASVLVPCPVDRAYSYAAPDGLDLKPGDYVSVPLGSREMPGIVWGDSDETVPSRKLKAVIARHDLPPMPAVIRRFLDWVADYNMAPRGMVLKMALSVPAALNPPKAVTGYRLSGWVREILDSSSAPSPLPSPHRGEGAARSKAGEGENAAKEKFLQQLSPQRRKIIDILVDGQPRRAAALAEEAGCTASVVKTMAAQNMLEEADIQPPPPCCHPDASPSGIALSPAQQKAADTLRDFVRKQEYRAALLDGVTGAGKTEVYFEAAAEALEQGRQVLILLPEIALSNAFLDRFKKRFGCAPALWHSNLSAGQRRSTWRGVAQGRTKVIVGARSALFLPYRDLGLIVVDEEHDPAYKQEEGVIYHARDMAVVRAHMEKIPVVLVSATPSLETMANIWAGKYELLHLPNRHGEAGLPQMHVINMKADRPPRGSFIAPALAKAIAENLERGEQSLLFLNRRGYAPLTLCRSCGHRMSCPRCTAWLVEHRQAGRLSCHHCGYGMNAPKACPACEDTGSFAACGPGVERIHEEVQSLFPQARCVVLASDTAENPDNLRELLRAIREREYDIVIGTQIIAKGHHFPHLTLVGVIDADLGLAGGDLRAGERTYQLLHQVAGRAGREDLPGHVYLQTFLPENKVMQALAGLGRDLFLDIEAAERRAANMPPYTRLAGIIVAGKDENLVTDTARALGKAAPQGEGIQTLGPAEAPFYRLRGNYRRRLLVRADKSVNVQKAIAAWLSQVKIPSSIRVYVDIDPQSFM